MASIKFLLQGKSQESSIYLRLSLGRGKDFKRKTGLFINHTDWSIDKAFPKQNLASNKILASKLKKLESKIFEDLNDSSSKGVSIDGEWLKSKIDLFFNRVIEIGTSDLLIDAVQDLIDNAHIRINSNGEIGISKSRVNAYKSLKNTIVEFSKNKKIKVKDVDLKFSQNFLNWLLDSKKYSKGTSLKKLDDLKSVCNNAEINGIEVSAQLHKIKVGEVKNDSIIYLTFEELNKIKYINIKSESLINTRKWLILGCNIGQRGGDLLSITKDNFIDIKSMKVIELIQQKTRKKVLIPLNKEVITIYDLGLPYKISIQKFNKHLKELCKIAEINTPLKSSKIIMLDKETKRKVAGVYPKYELVSSHICRRSFASNFYGKMPTNLIMQLTGHSTEKLLLSYIGKKSTDYIHEIASYFANNE